MYNYNLDLLDTYTVGEYDNILGDESTVFLHIPNVQIPNFSSIESAKFPAHFKSPLTKYNYKS